MKPLGALVQEEATIGSRSWEPAPKDPVQDLRRTLQSRVVVWAVLQLMVPERGVQQDAVARMPFEDLNDLRILLANIVKGSAAPNVLHLKICSKHQEFGANVSIIVLHCHVKWIGGCEPSSSLLVGVCLVQTHSAPKSDSHWHGPLSILRSTLSAPSRFCWPPGLRGKKWYSLEAGRGLYSSEVLCWNTELSPDIAEENGLKSLLKCAAWCCLYSQGKCTSKQWECSTSALRHVLKTSTSSTHTAIVIFCPSHLDSSVSTNSTAQRDAETLRPKAAEPKQLYHLFPFRDLTCKWILKILIAVLFGATTAICWLDSFAIICM